MATYLADSSGTAGEMDGGRVKPTKYLRGLLLYRQESQKTSGLARNYTLGHNTVGVVY